MPDSARIDVFNEKRGNIVASKSFAFSVRIVKAYKQLGRVKSEFVLSKQLLRSGTSIGANVEEAIGGYSKADFAAKMGIAYKEARETAYWIRLLKATEYLSEAEAFSLLKDADELLRITGAILIATKPKPK